MTRVLLERKIPMSQHVSSSLERSLFDRVRDLWPLSWIGVIVLGLSYYLKTEYGHDQQDYLLDASMSCLFFIILLLILETTREAFMISRWLKRLDPLSIERVEVGQLFASGFTLNPIRSFFGLKISGIHPLYNLRVRWVAPTAEDYELELSQGELVELVSCARRGALASVTREWVLEDIFGFTSIRGYATQSANLSVIPRSSKAPPMLLRQVQDGEDIYDVSGRPDGDPIELRRYQDGDSLKMIVWRLFARNRQLMVRTPERAFSMKRDLVAYFVADPSDESSASTARVYLERGLLGEAFTFFADGSAEGATDTSQALSSLIQSANGVPGSALPQLCALELQRQRGCVVFASAGTSIEVLSKIGRALPSPPTFILSYPHTPKAEERGRWARLFLRDEPRPNERPYALDFAQLHSTYMRLMAEGSAASLIAQPEGRMVSELELAQIAGVGER